ncbi:MAG: hypothetical protein EP343_11180 [Deltaproteobacteria bacterium]|nr:MAG: hypothetical protein EP343_11180 [Deltaproteobacteria bacterium]
MSWNKQIPVLSTSFNPASSGSQLSPDDIQLVILIDGATNLDGIAVLAGVEVEDLRTTFERFAEIGVITWKNVSLEDSRKKYSVEERTTSTGGEPPSIVGSKRLDRSPPPRREPLAPKAPTRKPTPPAPNPAPSRPAPPRRPADMPPPPPTPVPVMQSPNPVPRTPSEMPPPPPTPMPVSSAGSPFDSSPSATPPPPSAMTPPPPTSKAPASKGTSSFAKWEPKPSSSANAVQTQKVEEDTFESTLTEPPLSPKRMGSPGGSNEEEHTLDPGPYREKRSQNDGEQTVDEQPYASTSPQAPSRPMPLTSWEKEKLMRERGEAPPEEPVTATDSSSPSNPVPARPRSSRGLPAMPITSWEAKQGRLPSPSQENMPAAEEGLSKSEAELTSLVPEQNPTTEMTLQDHSPSGKASSLEESEEEWDSADDWWALMPEDVGLQRSDYQDLLTRRERRLQTKGLGEEEDEGDDGFTPQWREDIFGHLPMFQK